MLAAWAAGMLIATTTARIVATINEIFRASSSLPERTRSGSPSLALGAQTRDQGTLPRNPNYRIVERVTNASLTMETAHSLRAKDGHANTRVVTLDVSRSEP